MGITTQTYDFQVTVRDRDDRRHNIVGYATVQTGDFRSAMDEAMRYSFEKLTGGEGALFGHPGERGCRGPYRIDRVEITRRAGRAD